MSMTIGSNPPADARLHHHEVTLYPQPDIDVPRAGLLRRAVMVAALAGWLFMIFPWMFFVLRFSAVYTIATLKNVFAGGPLPDYRPLDYIAGWWARGFEQIIKIPTSDHTQAVDFRPRYIDDPAREFLYACLFWLFVLSTILWVAPLIAWLQDGVWFVVKTAFWSVVAYFK